MNQLKKTAIWIAALLTGVLLGFIQSDWLTVAMNFIATVYTRLFQLLAVPTIVLAVISTMASFGKNSGAGRIFRHTLTYTLLTTLAAAVVGGMLYMAFSPSNLPESVLGTHAATLTDETGKSYYEHIVSIIPNNIVRPMLDGNVLALLIISFSVGFALARMEEGKPKDTLLHAIQGLQDILFTLIRGLIWSLPLGIIAFSYQLAVQINYGFTAQALSMYVAVILAGNAIQFFFVLPTFLLSRGINPIRTLYKMMPAILMALFTKSSAATLPVTMQTAEERLHIDKKISRFVLPICTTINMNGCAAFILVTSLFVMQQSGMVIGWQTVALWSFISVIAAIGNAGVPMGCFFLTLSLMSGIGAPIAVLGLILPIYTIIDMVETAENVWSDSCVCVMTHRDISKTLG